MPPIPRATCRLQFHAGFTLDHAAQLVPYLHDLGISHLYASPLFPAGPQSSHGYDVCGFSQINPVLGGNEAFDRLSQQLASLGLGLLLDLVPNHMATDPSNAWWRHVLQLGPASPYAAWFDIDWHPPEHRPDPKILVPTLEAPYPRVLEAGKLRLTSNSGELLLSYYQNTFPLSPGSYSLIFDREFFHPPALAEFEDLQATCRLLADTPAPLTPARGGNPYSETQLSAFERLLSLLRSLHAGSPEFRARLAARLDSLNGNPAHPSSFHPLHAILQKQHYRLAFWRVGPEEINYRRFFDVSTLVSLRMELPEVFDATHQLVFSLLQQGKIHGLRIDHPDGLRDPKQYLQRLQERAHRLTASPTHHPLYVVVEKILTGDESLRPDWPAAGTTGYDFLNQLNACFVNPAAKPHFHRLYHEFTGSTRDFHHLVIECKWLILDTSLRSDFLRLLRRAASLAATVPDSQDLTLPQIAAALRDLVAAFPVYRSYAQAGVSPEDAATFDTALARARSLNPNAPPEVWTLLHRLLNSHPDFVASFQQLTSPVMAKGVEDTAFYRFNPLVSLNEVGGAPDQFGASPDRFHHQNLQRLKSWPHSLLATATHDTKRGEDVRARLNVLSELPDEWERALSDWSLLSQPLKPVVQGEPAPDPADEYLLYQTLLGAWPADPVSVSPEFVERIRAYMLKALKEAKRRTSWIDPNQPYESALGDFIHALLLGPASAEFLKSFLPLQRRIAFFGVFNSLSQVLVKSTAPGVPDFYQGAELWDLSLVDPDNRRPVDFDRRRALLDTFIRHDSAGTFTPDFLNRLLCDSHTGAVKLFLTWRSLQFRRRHPELFQHGDYRPLPARGPHADHVLAFARTWKNQAAITVVPRLVATLTAGHEQPPTGPETWGQTVLTLPPELSTTPLLNILTNQPLSSTPGPEIPLATVLQSFPVALLAVP